MNYSILTNKMMSLVTIKETMEAMMLTMKKEKMMKEDDDGAVAVIALVVDD